MFASADMSWYVEGVIKKNDVRFYIISDGLIKKALRKYVTNNN